MGVNFSGQDYQFVSYGVNPETETIDYDELERIAKEEKPQLIVAGASAYPREIDFKRISEIAKRSWSLLYGGYGAYCWVSR